jgi:hypothetical protein
MTSANLSTIVPTLRHIAVMVKGLLTSSQMQHFLKCERSRLMTQITYMMQFNGQVTPVGTSPNVLKATTTASSCTMTTVVGPDGLYGTIEPADGGHATFESEVTFIGGFESEATSTGEAGFKEAGTITFGQGRDRLRFSTIGQGYIAPSPDPNIKHGCVIWQVDGGEGRFEGARGLITSNFTVSAAGEVTDYHVGVLYVT